MKLLALSAGALGLLLVGSRSLQARPTLAWNPAKLEVTVAVGGNATVDVSFEVSETVGAVSVSSVPALAPWLQIQPAAIASIPANTSTSLAVVVSIPNDTPVGTYEGTIHVRSGRRTIARPLPVTITVTVSSMLKYVDPEHGYEIEYEPDFGVSEAQSTRPSFLGGVLFAVEDKLPNVLVSVYANSSSLPLEEWYEMVLANREYTFRDDGNRSSTQVMVGAIPSLQVRSNLLGHVMLRTFVPHDDKVFGIETNAPDFVDIPDSYFRMLDSFRPE